MENKISDRLVWKLYGGREITPAPFLIVGILNVTPDSFFDGGMYNSYDKALEHAGKMLEDGAHILDVGGESTRPFSRRVGEREEKSRVIPVIRAIKEKYPGAVISVDTYKGTVARDALNAGALIVNDVSGFRFDPSLLEVLSEFRPGYVLMHSLGRPEDMQRDPKYEDVVDEIMSFFEERMKILVDAGLEESNIVLDPGIGFGKLLEHNLEILKNIDKFYSLGRPIFMGLSNKSLWEKLLGVKVGEREYATQVATALLARRGVLIHRVHNVKLTFDTLKIVEAIGG